MRREIEKIWSFAQYLIFGKFLAEDLIFGIFGRNSDVELYSVSDTGFNWARCIVNEFNLRCKRREKVLWSNKITGVFGNFSQHGWGRNDNIP